MCYWSNASLLLFVVEEMSLVSNVHNIKTKNHNLITLLALTKVAAWTSLTSTDLYRIVFPR